MIKEIDISIWTNESAFVLGSLFGGHLTKDAFYKKSKNVIMFFEDEYILSILKRKGFSEDPQKSLGVPKKFFNEFLLGYFSADGEILLNPLRIQFVSGNRNNLKWIESKLRKYYGVPKARMRKAAKHKMTYRKAAAAKILQSITKDTKANPINKYAILYYLNHHGIDLSTYETPEFESLISNKI